MRRWQAVLVGASVLTLFGCQHAQYASEATSTPAPAIECEHVPGLVDGPYAGDEVTARQIAIAVIHGMERREGMNSRARDRLYDLHVDDGGDHWVVFQSVHGYPRREGDAIIVMAGGGGLEMEIAKCEGTITHLHWSR